MCENEENEKKGEIEKQNKMMQQCTNEKAKSIAIVFVMCVLYAKKVTKRRSGKGVRELRIVKAQEREVPKERQKSRCAMSRERCVCLCVWSE